jgi:hypothetical protein
VLTGDRLEVVWGTAELQLVLSDRFADHLMPERVVVVLDGTTVLQAPDAGEAGVYELLRGSLEPGEHQLRVIVRAQGKGRIREYRFEISKTHKFEVTDNTLTVVHVVARENPVSMGWLTHTPELCFVDENVARAAR